MNPLGEEKKLDCQLADRNAEAAKNRRGTAVKSETRENGCDPDYSISSAY